jgi:hypothetical protein
MKHFSKKIVITTLALFGISGVLQTKDIKDSQNSNTLESIFLNVAHADTPSVVSGYTGSYTGGYTGSYTSGYTGSYTGSYTSGYTGGYGCSGGGGSCFTEDTLITTPRGQIRISDIVVDDEVFVFETSTSSAHVARVNHVFIHDGEHDILHDFSEHPLLSISYAIQGSVASTTVTGNHPYLVRQSTSDTYKYIPAEEISVGDFLRTEENETVVQDIKKVPGNPVVYNLSIVDSEHNYFANGVVVHNKQAGF